MQLKNEFNLKKNYYYKMLIEQLIKDGIYSMDADQDDIYEDIKNSEMKKDNADFNHDEPKNVSDYINIEQREE